MKSTACFSLLLNLPLAVVGDIASATTQTAQENAIDLGGSKSPVVDRSTLDRVEITGSRPIGSTSFRGYTTSTNSVYTPAFGNRDGGGNPSSNQQKKVASDDNTAKDDPANPTSCLPVILATGEKVKAETDISVYGSYKLGLTRTYRSQTPTGYMFGVGWLSDYDYPRLLTSGCFRSQDYVGCIPTQVTVTFPDGARYTYTQSSFNGGFFYKVRGSAALGTMSYDPDFGWTLVTPTKVFKYSKPGFIQTVSTSGGTLLQLFSYGSDPQHPSSVSNAANESVSFIYNASKFVAQATDASGNNWYFSYNGNVLASVTSPGTNPDVRTYFYESPVAYYLLTGIAINGVRYSTYSYDSLKRVQTSGLAGGEELDQFAYAGNATTITDARGQSITYGFTATQGGRKVSSASRAATSTCTAGASQTGYDANGWPSYDLDWNGNRTDYSYDIAGKLLQVTAAVGTSSAATTVSTWTGDNLTQVTFRDAANNAFASISYTYVQRLRLQQLGQRNDYRYSDRCL